METIYNRMKGPSFFKRGSFNRFGVITLINIYRVCIHKISFPDSIMPQHQRKRKKITLTPKSEIVLTIFLTISL
jgi:hypothetical protein